MKLNGSWRQLQLKFLEKLCKTKDEVGSVTHDPAVTQIYSSALPANSAKTRDVKAVIFQPLPLTKNEKTTVDLTTTKFVVYYNQKV